MGPPGPNNLVYFGIPRLTYWEICTTRVAFSRGEGREGCGSETAARTVILFARCIFRMSAIGAKRTSACALHMSAFDPKRTFMRSHLRLPR